MMSHTRYAGWPSLPDPVPHDIVTPSVPSPHRSDATNPAQTAWQTHLDAGRLGANPPTAPHIAAARDHMTALFTKPGSVW